MFHEKVSQWLMSGIVTLLLLSVVVYGCAGATPTPVPPTATKPPSAAPPAGAATKAPAGTPAAAKAPAGTPAAAAKTKPSGTPIKIGYILPLSGAQAVTGVLQRASATLGMEDVNAAGGVNGRPIDLLTFDSPFNPQEAVQGVRKLAEQDKVFAIVGPFSSGETEAVAPLAKQMQVPLINASSSKPGVIAAGRPWTFRYAEVDEDAVPILIDSFKKVYPDVKKVVIAGDAKDAVNDFVTRNLYPKFLKEKGYDVIDSVTFQTNTTDFSAIVTKIKGLNPDGIAVGAFGGDAVALAKEMERQGLKVPVMSGLTTSGYPFLGLTGSAGEGWVNVRYSSPENPDPIFQKFLPRFNDAVKAANAKIDTVSVEPGAYDVVTILADIMRKNNITPETDLQQARAKIRDGFTILKDWQGLYGTVSINAEGEARWKVFAHLAKDGKWQLIK
ncbi:MAG: ABC transporter substrate-binding protein [Chloroflexi bacterium]|nr:ABC transporter substrate-binding protein [Chloroflexota bacterium]